MISRVQPPRRRPAGRGFVLLVLAVLAGVLAMHGLGPGPASVRAHATAAARAGEAGRVMEAGHVMPDGHVMEAGHRAPARPVALTAEGCSHTAGGPDHTHHADAACAATGIGTPYAPPAPAAALDGAVSAAGAPHAVATAAAQSGRAPPDLAELQLLRI
ncbi:DUF6153 family protein [Streptomyces sp. NPDC056367]|uniref:DUF6153 family protein n=1 Tax=Streptomyces sp. NPDC056367 TaxID=3345797 RepID=UPI0035DA8B23